MQIEILILIKLLIKYEQESVFYYSLKTFVLKIVIKSNYLKVKMKKIFYFIYAIYIYNYMA